MAVTYQGAVDTMLDYLDSHPGTDVDAYAATVADILLSGMAAGPVTNKPGIPNGRLTIGPSR